jgi:hemerythrin-like metal-binding protein
MATHNYPRLDEHKKLHDTFIEQLDMINDEFEIYTVGSQDMADRVGEITTTWLLEHIIDEDTKIAKHVTRG